MKVLQINSVYNYGSTGKITAYIHKLLPKYGIESIVCYGRLDDTNDVGVYRICSDYYSYFEHFRANITGIKYGGCELSTHKLIEIIKKEKPDVVHLQCINNYFVNVYTLLEWLRCNSIPTVLTLHAEFMYTGGCSHSVDCIQWRERSGCGQLPCPCYGSELKSMLGDRSGYMWRRMKNVFDGFNDNLVVVSVSPWLMERASQSVILKDKRHCVIYNGLDTSIFKYYNTIDLRKKHKCENKKVVFHVTPAFSANKNHIKGGYYVIELAKRLPDTCFIVAGKVIGNVDVPANVILLGEIDSQELLARYYSMADVTVLTSKRETFSMVCAESLCCGTPVVGFKAGAPEQIAIPEYSSFVDYGNIIGLKVAINEKISNKVNKKIISNAAQCIYSKTKMIEKYISVYKDIMK